MTPDGMDVRPCTTNELLTVERQWAGAAEVARAHFAEQESGRTTFLIAWDGPDPLGWAVFSWDGCLGANARTRFPDCAEVIHLQVRPEHRGHGVGSELIAAAEREIDGRGLWVAGSVAANNPDALRLYLRLGYQRTGIVDVSEYSWTDAHGVVHQEHETNELIIKAQHRD
jgi:GNAT superfamily N-acetyltransferase